MERSLTDKEREEFNHIINADNDGFGLLWALYLRERELSREDFKTGTLNERAFKEILDSEIKRSRRHVRPLTVLYIDLDNFKLVNDSLGHKTGNSVLRVATRTMQSTLREVDFVARLHGDEFALLLPETSAENVPLVLNKLQKVLREAMIAMQWPVTFSIGAVTFKTPTVSAECMLDEADKVMYSAKHAGKNRVAHMIPQHW